MSKLTTSEEVFGGALVLATVVGLLVPALDRTPDWVLVTLLCVLMFWSVLQIPAASFRLRDVRAVLSFCSVRFLALPLAVYFAASWILVDYQTELLILTLLPAGVMAPAVTSLLRGNTAIAYSVVIVSSVSLSFGLPLLSHLLPNLTMGRGWVSLLGTLWFVLVVPPVVFFVLARWAAEWVPRLREAAGPLTIVTVASIIVLAVAQNRTLLSGHPEIVIESIVLSLLAFGLYYALGWFLSATRSEDERISYIVASGVNNVGLGIGLAVLYFAREVAVFLAMSEFSWIAGLILVRRLGERARGDVRRNRAGKE